MLKKIFGLLISLIIFLVSLLFFFKLFDDSKQTPQELLRNHEKSQVINEGLRGSEMDESLGAIPHLKVRTTKYQNDKVLYDVIYEHDDHGLRKTEANLSKSYDEHLIIAGCSFTYGDGLNVEESLPFLMERELLRINSYNLGVRGGGLSTILFYMERGSIKKIIKEKRGKFIYLFMSNHPSRWLARPDFLSWAWESYPYYENKNGKIYYKGPLKDQTFYKLFKKAQELGFKKTPQLLALKNKNDFSEDELKNFVEGIDLLRDSYLKAFPEGEFYLLINFSEKNQITNRVTQLAKRLGISTLDASEPFFEMMSQQNVSNAEFVLPDGHPGRKGNELMRDFILDSIYQGYR